MDLKLNILKRKLATTEEVATSEYTLTFGHIFRGQDGADGNTPRLRVRSGYMYVSYDNGASWSVLHPISSETVFSITHTELRTLRDAGQLMPGMFYRITDYATTTSQPYTQSAGHPFDIIVQALDENTLSEDARAIQREGDTYFAKSNLAAWELKYTIDNDTKRFAWATADILERAQSWKTSWGILESRLDAETSTNYRTAIVNGVTKYLYAPAERGTFLDSKEFYRIVGAKVYTSMDELLVASELNPFDYEYEASAASEEGGDDEWADDGDDGAADGDGLSSLQLFVIDRATGNIVDTLDYSDSWGYEEDDEGNRIYNITFSRNSSDSDGEEEDDYGSNFHMVHTEGDTTMLGGKTYYIWTEYEGDYYNMEEVYLNTPIGGTKEIYTGSKANLYYAFDNALPSTSSQPKPQIYSVETNLIYQSDNWSDSVTWTSYIPQDIKQGIIYFLKDERGNSAPYDFKNIQFEHQGVYYYTFNLNKDNSDLSLTNAAMNNTIVPLYRDYYSLASTYRMKIQRVVFDCSATSSLTSTNRNAGIYGNIVDAEIYSDFYVTANHIAYNKWCGLCHQNDYRGFMYSFIIKPLEGKSMSEVSSNTFTIEGYTQFEFFSTAINGNSILYAFGNMMYTVSCYLFRLLNSNIVWRSGRKAGNLVLGNAESAATVLVDNCDIHILKSCSLTLNFSLYNTKIKVDQNVTLTTPNTISLSSPMCNLDIDLVTNSTTAQDISVAVADNIGQRTSYLWKIAHNSAGEIKQWCEADWVDLIGE